MTELGYQPDRRASRLAAAHTGVIGVQFTLESEFHSRLLRCLYAESTHVGYELLLSGVTAGRQHREAIATLQEARPDGLILIDPGDIESLTIDEPLVVIGHAGPAAADRTFTASGAGVRQSLDHLVGLGHTDVCYLAFTEHPVGEERVEAYRAYMRERELPTRVLHVDRDSVEGGAAAVQALLGESLPTAVLAYNDEVAVGLIVELMRHGTRVPDDVSVVGFDDIGRLATGLGLTTVSQHMEHLAAAALRLVVERVDVGEPRPDGPARVIIEPSLRVRSSTGPPRA